MSKQIIEVEVPEGYEISEVIAVSIIDAKMPKILTSKSLKWIYLKIVAK